MSFCSRLFIFVLALLMGGAGFGAAPLPAELTRSAATEPLAPITSIAGAFARWPELKSDNEPVQLTGVVTGTMPSGAFRLHDGELGLYVTKPLPGYTLTTGEKLTPGERVTVSGVLRMGGFSPWITPREWTRLGRGEFPQPRTASYSVLASGVADNQWVEVEGVVRNVHVPEPRDFAILDLGMSGGTLRALVNFEPGTDYLSLIDAAVKMRGVAAVNVNAQKHVVEPSFRVPSFSEITVVRPGRADPFAQPHVPVRRMMRFSLWSTQLHRVRISGVVTRQFSDTTLFVREGDAGLKVQTDAPQRFKVGDVIDAAGFPVMTDGMAVLRHAICRTVGTTSAPIPAEPTLSTLLEGTHDSDLIKMRARLVDWAIAGQNITLILQTGDHLFKGMFNLRGSAPLSLPEKNSVVDVTGVCVINELEDLWFYQPRSFLLLIADLTDVRLVQAPPWWTPGRLSRALMITCAVLFAAVGWVWALRRQIDRKRAVIEQQARHAAALEERSRIARELHDTLEQGLTGLSLQMKAMETDLGQAPHPAGARLQAARQMLRQSRALARNAIRELRTETLPSRLEGLIDGLKRVADAWNHSGALTVSVEVLGAARPLPAALENHLLGIGTEAMTNAVKHGRAERIQVAIIFSPGEISVRIKDNGAGFDPAGQLDHASGCFGLIGMRERAREVRGELNIESRLGEGAEVFVSAPTGGEVAPISPVAGEPETRPTLPMRARPV